MSVHECSWALNKSTHAESLPLALQTKQFHIDLQVLLSNLNIPNLQSSKHLATQLFRLSAGVDQRLDDMFGSSPVPLKTDGHIFFFRVSPLALFHRNSSQARMRKIPWCRGWSQQHESEKLLITVDAQSHFGEVRACLDCDLKDLAVCSNAWGQTGFADRIFIMQHPRRL